MAAPVPPRDGARIQTHLLVCTHDLTIAPGKLHDDGDGLGETYRYYATEHFPYIVRKLVTRHVPVDLLKSVTYAQLLLPPNFVGHPKTGCFGPGICNASTDYTICSSDPPTQYCNNNSIRVRQAAKESVGS